MITRLAIGRNAGRRRGYRVDMFTPGLLVGDRYRLDEPIAAGGMGEVWQATDTVLGRTVALKLLHRMADDTAQARFRGEARAMAALRHPGVAEVYDYGEADLPDGTGAAYIAMARVDGEPLSRRIIETGRLDAAETRSVVAQAARALQAVHDAGVVHRDVKPGNMIIEPDGTVVLIDFGVAVTAGTAGQTRADEVVGTALYMAPEQVTKAELTPATDIYALGAVTYHLLAGKPPFGGTAVTVALSHLQDDPAPLPDDVPSDLRQVVETAMAKDPGRRFPNAAAMADAVDGGHTGAATAVLGARAAVPATEPQPHTPRPRSQARRSTVGAVLVVLATLLAVAAIGEPTGSIPMPGGGPPPGRPATTGDAEPPARTNPSGGAGGAPRPSGDGSAATPTPTGAPVAGEPPTPGATAPPDGEATADPPPADDPADPPTGGESPEPTPSPEPPTPTGTSAPDGGDAVAGPSTDPH